MPGMRLNVARVRNESEHDCQRGGELHVAQAHYYQNGLEILGGTIWIPDEILFNIFSFMSDGNITVNTTNHSNSADGIHGCPSDDGIPALFRNLVYVSKDVYSSLFRHVRYTPVKLNGSLHYTVKSFERIAWLCKHKAKLGEYKVNIFGANAFALLKYVLISCDATKLEVCHLDLFTSSICSGFDSVALRSGIPSHVIQEHNSMTVVEFQRFFAEYVPKHATSLKSMKIDFWKGELNLPLLTSLSDSLEELELIILPKYRLERTSKLKKLSLAIAQLSKLKKFQLDARFDGSFQIHSTSLEEIETTCGLGFFIDKCVCPSLKMFKCMHVYIVNRPGFLNGIRPVVPYSKEDRKDMTAKRKVAMTAGSRAFIGINVPEACMISIKCKFNNNHKSIL